MPDFEIQTPAAYAEVLANLIGEPDYLPGEDPLDFANLRAAILSDFAPQKPYERVIVDNIVHFNLEQNRHCMIREKLIERKFRDAAYDIFSAHTFDAYQAKNKRFQSMRNDPKAIMHTAEAGSHVYRLMGPHDETRALTVQWLEALGSSVKEIVAQAHLRAAPDIEYHDNRIAELERCRRKLVEDLNGLRGTKAKTIES